MVIAKKKLKDLLALKAFTHPEATKWIQSVAATQNGGHLRQKSQIQDDDAIYFNMENQEDELDLDIDPEGAIVMAEDYHGDHTEDGVEEIVQETCETEKKSKKGKGFKGKRKQADTGNIVIKLFIIIRTNNPIKHFC